MSVLLSSTLTFAHDLLLFKDPTQINNDIMLHSVKEAKKVINCKVFLMQMALYSNSNTNTAIPTHTHQLHTLWH